MNSWGFIHYQIMFLFLLVYSTCFFLVTYLSFDERICPCLFSIPFQPCCERCMASMNCMRNVQVARSLTPPQCKVSSNSLPLVNGFCYATQERESLIKNSTEKTMIYVSRHFKMPQVFAHQLVSFVAMADTIPPGELDLEVSCILVDLKKSHLWSVSAAGGHNFLSTSQKPWDFFNALQRLFWSEAFYYKSYQFYWEDHWIVRIKQTCQEALLGSQSMQWLTTEHEMVPRQNNISLSV